MAEAAKVRLVRCPQCENLLPELPDFSVYQCGGCDAVLRAKGKGLLDDGISEISGDEKSGGVSGEGDVVAGIVSDFRAERESNGIEPGKVERDLNENGVFNNCSSSATENKGFSANFNRPRRGTEGTDRGIDQNRKTGFRNYEYRNSSQISHDNWVQDGSSCGLNTKRPAYVTSNSNSELEEDLSVGSLRSRPAINQKSVDRTSSVASRPNATGVSGQRTFANFPYANEGPSNYSRGSLYNCGDYMTCGDNLDVLARVQNLENDRAELLRKLDELADQLSRSCNVAEKPRERGFHGLRIPPAPPDSYGRHDACVQEGASISYGVNKQPIAPDKHVSRPPYLNHSHGYPFISRHVSAVQEPYSSANRMQEYQGFADAYQPQMLRRLSRQLPRQYFQESGYEHFPVHYMDFNQDLFMSHPPESFFHQPACSCLHCFNKNWHAPKMQPSNFSSLNEGNNYIHRIPYPPANPVAYGPQCYISEGSNLPQPHSRDRQPLTRSSSDLGRETGGFGLRHLRKVVVAQGNGRVFHPVAGGAPFITCCNCWELLKLPRKVISLLKNHKKIKCGACSSILLFELERKGMVVSVRVETERVIVNIASTANEMPALNFRHSNDFLDTCAVNNYENFNYDFQLADDEPDPSLRDQISNFGAQDVRQDPHLSSSISSEDEQSPDSLVLRKDVSCSAKDEACLSLPDSPSQEYPDHPSSDKVTERNGQGNKSKRIEQEKNIQDGITSRQNSLKDALVAAEIDVSYNDHSNTVVSNDSVEVRKDEDQPKIKGSESFFVGLIKRSFGEFSRSSKTTESGRSNVSVNGHFIPDRVVKKAEKLAGTILPGDYWYDFRAGFWGVMGHPCLGIIPPNIDEFDYPIPQDCSRGNTGVFVNGRELHQKDLDLLAGRGLPTMRHKSYLIEISGRVVDEDTGEELDTLGKLAPTVDKAKRGFGMKVPQSLLQQQQR